jgi:hypothetical protein
MKVVPVICVSGTVKREDRFFNFRMQHINDHEGGDSSKTTKIYHFQFTKQETLTNQANNL